MAAGFVIATGAGNLALEGGLCDLVAEIRVEQEISKATKYAVRFEEDICEGQPKALSATALRAGEMVSVLVPDEKSGDTVCLVRGPITKVKSSSVLGGPGSWLEVHGEDRRIEMDRTPVSAVWTGRATDVASAILALHQFQPEVKASEEVVFEEGTRSLNQSSADLQVMNDLARRLGYEFWIAYTVEAGVGATSFMIIESGVFQPSPDYGSAASASASPTPTLDQLVGDSDEIVLRLNVTDDPCRNISAFDIDVDVEKATAALLAGVDERSGAKEEDEPTNPPPPVAEAAQTTLDTYHVVRTINPAGAGSAADRASETRATLAAESWFVTATASTTAHLLRGVLQPHELVRVEGSGFAHSGRYQVSKVLHVINPWAHLMDVTLRRNALPEAGHA
ncbi:MAG: hypothetical protein ACK40O_09125 [Allosphingosinicella sp.]